MGALDTALAHINRPRPSSPANGLSLSTHRPPTDPRPPQAPRFFPVFHQPLPTAPIPLRTANPRPLCLQGSHEAELHQEQECGAGSISPGPRPAPPMASARRVFRQPMASTSTPHARDKQLLEKCCHQAGRGAPPSGRRRAPPTASARRVWRQTIAATSKPQPRCKCPFQCCHKKGGGVAAVGSPPRTTNGVCSVGLAAANCHQRPNRNHFTCGHSIVDTKGGGGCCRRLVDASRQQGRRLGGSGGCRLRQRQRRKQETSAHSIAAI